MTSRRVDAGPGREIHRARWVVADAATVWDGGYVVTENGWITEAGPGRPPADGRLRDHGDAVLMPAPVNAHTHLELSALAGRVPTQGGFTDWVRRLLTERAAVSPAELANAALDAATDLARSGCGAVGEISTLGLTRDTLGRAALSGVWFRESLGNGPMDADESMAPGNDESPAFSLAGHAPHTTSPGLLRDLRSRTRAAGLPFSLHLAESVEEEEFLRTGRGEWAEFLAFRGIDISGWPLPADSAVAYADGLGLLGPAALAVHLIQAGPLDLDRVAGSGAAVCVCPRSNLALHGRMADVPGLLRRNIPVCLGTDSLASAPSLNPLHETAALAAAYPELRPADIFHMLTSAGASALGLGRVSGRLAPGFRGRMARVTHPEPSGAFSSSLSSPSLLEALIHVEHPSH